MNWRAEDGREARGKREKRESFEGVRVWGFERAGAGFGLADNYFNIDKLGISLYS